MRDGLTKKVWLEAASFEDAKEIAASWGVGILGETDQPELQQNALPEAYDERTARTLLGGISKSTLYREIQDGKLERVPHTRRILITRSSLEARKSWRALAGHSGVR